MIAAFNLGSIYYYLNVQEAKELEHKTLESELVNAATGKRMGPRTASLGIGNIDETVNVTCRPIGTHFSDFRKVRKIVSTICPRLYEEYRFKNEVMATHNLYYDFVIKQGVFVLETCRGTIVHDYENIGEKK